MDLDQLHAVIRQVCPIDDQDEMAAMLNFYHDLGVIVKHGHTVVLEAQWLIDLFKKLITVRPFNEAVSKVLCAFGPLCFTLGKSKLDGSILAFGQNAGLYRRTFYPYHTRFCFFNLFGPVSLGRQ